jgi:hypothetical protein
MTHSVLSLLLVLALSACVSEQPGTNVTQMYVTPWTHLSPADHAAIVRLITARDDQPIIGISAHEPSKEDRSTISVYTGRYYKLVPVDPAVYKPWHGYNLARKSGTWQITFHGDCSQTIANLDLSGEFRRLQQKRSNRSNHAMERTPTRRALTLYVMGSPSLRPTRALGDRRSSYSR